jgi:PII-like signaling protein
MLGQRPAKKLVVTVFENDHWHGQPVYRALLALFRKRGLPQANVFRGHAGYRGHGVIHTADLVDLAAPLPVRVEVLGTPDAIDRVLPDVYDIVERGSVELLDIQLVKLETGELPDAEPDKEEPLVRLIGKAKMLRIHIGENDKWEGAPLYEAIVKRARQLDLAGATVYRGILGYGAQGRVHKHKTLALSHDDPILISVIDEEAKVNALLAALDSMVSGGCLISISDVTVVKYVEHAEAERRTGPLDTGRLPGDGTT